jgi:hypothetical protein
MWKTGMYWRWTSPHQITVYNRLGQIVCVFNSIEDLRRWVAGKR